MAHRPFQIHFIKWLRGETKMGLKEAKDISDRIHIAIEVDEISYALIYRIMVHKSLKEAKVCYTNNRNSRYALIIKL